MFAAHGTRFSVEFGYVLYDQAMLIVVQITALEPSAAMKLDVVYVLFRTVLCTKQR